MGGSAVVLALGQMLGRDRRRSPGAAEAAAAEETPAAETPYERLLGEAMAGDGALAADALIAADGGWLNPIPKQVN
jgi:hypothetical protein